jgi:hypothetical protein
MALNQYSIAGALSTAWTIITGNGLQFEGGLKIGPGVVNAAKGYTGDDIRKSFIELKPAPPDNSLLELVKHAKESAQQNTQSQDILSGAPGKSGETAYGVGLRREQAMGIISVPAKAFADRFLKQVLKNNAKLNSIFLDDHEVPTLLNHLQMNQEDDALLGLGRELYAGTFDAEIVADMRFATQTQKVAEADEVTALVLQFVQAMQATPPGAQELVFQSYKAALVARGKKDLVPLLAQARQGLAIPQATQQAPGAAPAQQAAPPPGQVPQLQPGQPQ